MDAVIQGKVKDDRTIWSCFQRQQVRKKASLSREGVDVIAQTRSSISAGKISRPLQWKLFQVLLSWFNWEPLRIVDAFFLKGFIHTELGKKIHCSWCVCQLPDWCRSWDITPWKKRCSTGVACHRWNMEYDFIAEKSVYSWAKHWPEFPQPFELVWKPQKVSIQRKHWRLATLDLVCQQRLVVVYVAQHLLWPFISQLFSTWRFVIMWKNLLCMALEEHGYCVQK